MLKFDAATTQVLEAAYLGADITRRRQASFEALRPDPQDVIVDIGCGNGLQVAELARAVGPEGAVIGIDPSSDMLAAAAERCAGLSHVSLKEGTADTLPLEAGHADKAVSLQVFEYLSDVPAALKEAHRVLRPGGRLVIGDMDFDSWMWFSDDPARMARMKGSWNTHVENPRLPQTLPGLMRDAGFEIEDVKAVPFLDTVLRPDGFARMTMILMESHALRKGHLEPEAVRDWRLEQEDLARQGRFFFCLTHVVVSARRA